MVLLKILLLAFSATSPVEDLRSLEEKFQASLAANDDQHQKEVSNLGAAWQSAMQEALDECLERKDLAGANLIDEVLKLGANAASRYSGDSVAAKAACRAIALDLQKAETAKNEKAVAIKEKYLDGLNEALSHAFESKNLAEANQINAMIAKVRESIDATSKVPKDFDAQALRLEAIKKRDDSREEAIIALRKAIGERRRNDDGRRLAAALDRTQDLGKLVATVREYETKIPKDLRPAMDTAIFELKQAEHNYRTEIDRIAVLERALQIERLREAIRGWDTELAFELAFRANVILDRSRLTANHKEIYALPSPPLPSSASDVLEAFDAKRESIAGEFDREANTLAQTFFKQLQSKGAGLTKPAKQIVDESINAVQGKDLEHLRLFPLYASERDRSRIVEFQQSLAQIVVNRNAQWELAVEEMKRSVAPSLDDFVAQEEFDAALSVLWHVRDRSRHFRPLAVLAAKKPWQAPVLQARVLDVAGNLCLLQFMDDDRATWHPRQLIRLEGEKYRFGYTESAFTDDWKLYDEFAPSPSIGRASEVNVGQRVFFIQGNAWVLGSIQSITATEATVEWTDSRPRKDTFAFKFLHAAD